MSDLEIPGAGGSANVSDAAYDATAWDGDTDAPTKNAVRDKIETLGVGHDPVTVTDSDEINFTLTGQGITAVLKAGSIVAGRLATAVQTSLGKADNALPKAGGTMTGNIALNGNYLSGDGGDEGVFVDSSGNVGIGTDSPSVRLSVLTPNVSSSRETIAQFGIEGVANSLFSIGNFTGTNDKFIPAFVGYNANDDRGISLAFRGILEDAYDNTSSDLGVVDFAAVSTDVPTDPNNNIGVVSNKNLFSFRNNTTQVMTIDADGNVGIGTTTPGAKLHVAGTARFSNGGSNDRGVTITPSWTSETDNGTLFTAYGVAGESSSNGTFRFDNLGGNLVTIDSTGNVGIGTTAPETLLEISSASPILRVTNSEDKVTWTPGDKVGALEFYVADTSNNFPAVGGAIEAINTIGTGFSPRVGLRFLVNNNVVTANEAMRITSSGNVGIGTTDPDTLLHNAGAYTQESLSSDPADPDAGNSVQWVSDGTGSGDAGDIMLKVNVGGTTKVITLIDYSVA